MIRDSVNTLLVDDQKFFADYMQGILAEAPCFEYHVQYVDNLTDAKCLIENDGIELVILDLRVPPERTTVGSVAAIRQKSERACLVVLSGEGDYRINTDCMKAGADEFIVKTQHSEQEMRNMIRDAVVAKRAKLRLAPISAVVERAEEFVKRCEDDPELPPYKDVQSAETMPAASGGTTKEKRSRQ